MSKPRLLVVDDDADLRNQMRWALAGEYEVSLAEDRIQALRAVRIDRPAAITLDLGLAPAAQGVQEGFATLSALIQENPRAKVIVVTGRDEREHAVRAVSMGAHDYFLKPVELEELKVVLRRACRIDDLQQESVDVDAPGNDTAFEGMVGASAQMRGVFDAIKKVAASEVPVLVVGESGTGKELVARAIHRLGPRGAGAFVAINCGAIPDALLESELFGHEKGSFTGAHVQRKGRIELAHGGTLFLDEIGELPLSLQVKLLRFLQERRLERVGGRESLAVDTRVIAATNVDLVQAMKDGRFREDLYYRIGVVVIVAPPLRERRGDIPVLARVLLERYAAEARKGVGGFTPEALRALATHGWPGNVRELENRLRRAVVMAEGLLLTPADLELARLPNGGHGLRDVRQALERETIKTSLSKNKGNVSRTAAELGVSRPTLYDLMAKLGIARQERAGAS